MNNEMTKKDFMQIISDIIESTTQKNDTITMMYYCVGKERRITQSSSKMELCDHPDCTNCQGLQKEMQNELKSFKDRL
jgi:hypothetical protein